MMKEFTLDYAPSAVQHLGVGLYKQLPQAMAELITNCWDADASVVNIKIDYEKKTISIEDNGNGMSYEELNLNFLRVAKNRRVSEKTDLSPKGRKVTGKKGLGKLALFGIAKKIQIFSKKDGLENAFEMNYETIQNTPEDERYHPKTLKNKEKCDFNDKGTKIFISDLTIKSITPLESLYNSLARRFDKYSSDEFLVKLVDEKNNEKILDEKAFEKSIKPNETQFIYKFPEDFLDRIKDNKILKKLKERGITGTVYTKKTPLTSDKQGFCVLSRGKLASDQDTRQFSSRANDNFYLYSCGFFDIDFIDEDLKNDYISTDRQKILWDASDDLEMLRGDLNKLMGVIQNRWRKDREKVKNEKIDRTISKVQKLKSIIESPNLTPKDKKTLTSVTDLLEDNDVIISENKKKKLLNEIASNTETNKLDNSVYNELMPSNFFVPNTVGSKLRRLREELVYAVSDEEDNEKFILTQGLLLRALLESTTYGVLIENINEINDYKLIQEENELEKYHYDGELKTNTQIENLPLGLSYHLMIRFLCKKGALNKRRKEVFLEQFDSGNVTKELDLLMHDSYRWPHKAELKKIWDIVGNNILVAFEYMKNKKE